MCKRTVMILRKAPLNGGPINSSGPHPHTIGSLVNDGRPAVDWVSLAL